MNQAFYSGLSGLQSHQTGIDVVADNLASINTVGYRGYTTEFSNIFDDVMGTYESTSSLVDSVGYGSYINSISMDESQGSLMITDSNTDVAIDGNGWFGVQTANDEILYTRAGNFMTDANYNLVTRNEGFNVLGTLGNNMQNGVLTQELNEVALTEVNDQVPLTFPKDLYYPATPTTKVNFYGNLGLEDVNQTMSSGIVLVDGEKRLLKLLFSKSDDQPDVGIDWDVVAQIQSLDGETTYSTQEGKTSFSSSGALTENTLTSIDNEGTPIAIDLGSGYNGVISIGREVTSSYSTNDGVDDGHLVGYNIDINGQVSATFTNGRFSAVANIALYHFINDQGLDRYSGTHFSQSSNSGEALFYKDANGNSILGASILNHKLENSNVKMEVGMTELIIMQRAHSANSKSVTTADELIQKALDMDA
ncbi:MAG: flagellar hook-basal body complex protein [Campylobacterota bacterium]|nr:flagellar hook-basal body complex protein [Campylobacterota bacterium]